MMEISTVTESIQTFGLENDCIIGRRILTDALTLVQDHLTPQEGILETTSGTQFSVTELKENTLSIRLVA